MSADSTEETTMKCKARRAVHDGTPPCICPVPKQKSIQELIANSSIGHAMADIKKRGIDAHVADLETETTPKRFRGETKRSAALYRVRGRRSMCVHQNVSTDDLLARLKQNAELQLSLLEAKDRAKVLEENRTIDDELRQREAQHSVDLRNKLIGQDPRLKITRDALVSKLLDTARRLDRELAQLRQDLDRLRSFD